MGWDGYPTTTDETGKILFSKKAELILNSEYYPKGELDEFPVDPKTGKKLEIQTVFKKESKPSLSKQEIYSLSLFLIVIIGVVICYVEISKRHEVKPKRVIVIPETYLDERI